MTRNKKTELLPLYSATQSLDVNYKFEDWNIEDAEVRVQGAEIHACLSTSDRITQKIYKSCLTVRVSSLFLFLICRASTCCNLMRIVIGFAVYFLKGFLCLFEKRKMRAEQHQSCC